MNKEMTDKITFTMDDGETIELFVEADTKINGCNYLLVSDSKDDDGVGYIMKEVQGDADSVSYEMVEDETEINAVADIFSELLDDIDIVGEGEE